MSTTAPGATHNTLESGTFLHPFTDFAEYKNQGGKTYVRGEGIFIVDHLGNVLASCWQRCGVQCRDRCPFDQC